MLQIVLDVSEHSEKSKDTYVKVTFRARLWNTFPMFTFFTWSVFFVASW